MQQFSILDWVRRLISPARHVPQPGTILQGSRGYKFQKCFGSFAIRPIIALSVISSFQIPSSLHQYTILFILKYILDANVQVCSLALFFSCCRCKWFCKTVAASADKFFYFPYTVCMLNMSWTVMFLFSTRCCFTKVDWNCHRTSKQPLLPLPVSVHLHNTEELETAEEILQSSEARQMMVSASM